MMNKKGFTLVELIAVIVLLAIISTIAIVSISSVKGKVDERQYKSLAATIISAAEKYAADTGVTKMFVQTLIDKGLVQTDDESKQIYDPRSNSSMNCRTIELDENNNFVLSDDGSSCDVEILKEHVLSIMYCEPGKNGMCDMKKVEDDTWFHSPIDLYVKPNDQGESIGLDLEHAEYSWISPLAPDKVGKDKIYNVNSNYVDDEYQVTVTSGGRDYIATQRIKMDQTSPRVYDFALTDPGSWKVIKKVTFKISDYESGLAAYALSTSNTIKPADSDWKTDGINKAGDNTAVITTDYNFSGMGEENVKLYVWVKDVAGNTNEDDLRNGIGSGVGIDIGNLDTKIDSVSISKNTDEYVQSVTLTGTAEDEKSGIVGYQFTQANCKKDDGKLIDDAITTGSWTNIAKTNSITQTKSGVSTPGDWYFWVKDDADNVNCAKVNVSNIDTSIDFVSVKSDETSTWTTSAVITGSATDNQAGIIGWQINQTNCSGGRTLSSGWTAVSRTTSITNKSKTVSANGTYYFWVKDNANNQSCKAININHVGRLTTTSFSFSSRYSSQVSGSGNVTGTIRQINSYSINNGRFSTYPYISNNQIKAAATGGTTQTGYDPSTCSYPDLTYSRRADEEDLESCSCTYGNYNSYSKTCTPRYGYSFKIYNRRRFKCTCLYNNSSMWTCGDCIWQNQNGTIRYGNCVDSTRCDKPNYERSGGATCKNFDTIVHPATSGYGLDHQPLGAGDPPLHSENCSAYADNTTTTQDRYCEATCYWQGETPRCVSAGTAYTCGYGETKRNTGYQHLCYSCPSGYTLNTYSYVCQRSCLIPYTYWEYTVTVTYIYT